mmetsp:Transcript_3519/g.7680  ORF Transcript_3519/g.7680 Transcript_3519/m.7680 type:complete len:774 (+) Transcript_3519:329-2650(+)
MGRLRLRHDVFEALQREEQLAAEAASQLALDDDNDDDDIEYRAHSRDRVRYRNEIDNGDEDEVSSSCSSSDDETVASKVSLASVAFSTALSLVDEIVPPEEGFSKGMPKINRPERRRNWSNASAQSRASTSSVFDSRRAPAYDTTSFADLITGGKSKYLKELEAAEKNLHGGLRREDFHASALLWDMSSDLQPTDRTNNLKRQEDQEYITFLNDMIEGDDHGKVEDEPIAVAERSERSLQRSRSMEAFPSKRRGQRRRGKGSGRQRSNSAHSVGSYEAIRLEDEKSKDGDIETMNEKGQTASIPKSVSSVSQESRCIEAKLQERSRRDENKKASIGASTTTTEKKHRSILTSASSLSLDLEDDIIDRLGQEGANADGKKKASVGASATTADNRHRSILTSASSLSLDLEDEIINRLEQNEATRTSARRQPVASTHHTTKPRSTSRSHRSSVTPSSSVTPWSISSVPSVIGMLDKELQTELAAKAGEEDVDKPLFQSTTKPSMRRQMGLQVPVAVPASAASTSTDQEIQEQEILATDAKPRTTEARRPTLRRDEYRKKKSAYVLINLINSSIDTLDNELDDAPSPTRGTETPDNLQQSRPLGKLLIDSLDDDLGDARNGNAALGDGPVTRKNPSSFSKQCSLPGIDSTRFGDIPNGNRKDTNAAARDRPAMHEDAGSFDKLKGIVGDLVGDEHGRESSASTERKKTPVSLASIDHHHYEQEISIIDSVMGRTTPIQNGVAHSSKARPALGRAKTSGRFGGMFSSIMQGLGDEEA